MTQPPEPNASDAAHLRGAALPLLDLAFGSLGPFCIAIYLVVARVRALEQLGIGVTPEAHPIPITAPTVALLVLCLVGGLVSGHWVWNAPTGRRTAGFVAGALAACAAQWLAFLIATFPSWVFLWVVFVGVATIFPLGAIWTYARNSIRAARQAGTHAPVAMALGLALAGLPLWIFLAWSNHVVG